jgi:hypothetical protein
MNKITLSVITTLFTVAINAQDAPPKPPLEDFVGKYVFPDGSVVPDVTVTLDGSALTMASTAGTSALAELGRDSFSIVEFSGTAVFKRGDDKKVNGVHIEAMGYVLDGQKQNNGAWAFTGYVKPKEYMFGRRQNQKS